MAAVDFSFSAIDARSSPTCQNSGEANVNLALYKAYENDRVKMDLFKQGIYIYI